MEGFAYCEKHDYMKGYTAERSNNLKYCARCYNWMAITNPPCQTCKDNIKKNNDKRKQAKQ